MTILQYLKKLLGSKEAMVRLKNNQLAVFNAEIGYELEMSEEIDENGEHIPLVYDAGDFIFKNISFFGKLTFISLEDMFLSDIPYMKNFLKDYALVRISKKQMLICKIIHPLNKME